MNPTSTFEVRNPELEEIMRDIGARIALALPKGYVFSFFVAPPEAGMFYISNSKRLEMTKGLHEHVERHCKDDAGHCASCGCPAAAWEKKPGGGYVT